MKTLESYTNDFADSMLNDDDDSGTRIEPGSHKEHLENIDDDETVKEKKDDKTNDEKANDDEKKDETGNVETRKEKMQTPIPSPTRSPRKNLSSNKTISQELMETVSPSTATTSKAQCKTRQKDTNNVIEGNLKRIMADIVIQERDALQAEVPTLVLKEFIDQAPQIIEELFKSYVSNNVIQSNLQDQAADPELWDVLKRKFEKPSASTTSCRDDAFRLQHHDDHQEDDAPLEGEKRAKRHKTSKSLKSARSSSSKQPTNEVIYEDTPLELIDEFQNADKHIPTIYDYARIMATLNDVMSNQFKDAKEITKVVGITTYQQHELDYMEQIIVMRENDKPDIFFKADFKYLNKNDIEDLNYLCLNKKVDFSHDSFSIVDKPSTGLIYLNIKEEKRVMYLVEIVKFCDATLERVLKEVKLKIFKSEPWKKPPLLGELDRDILKTFEREISKRLRHRVQIRRWESFMNGRPILPVMR
ncbi:hypothetical protein Tco_1360316 [Tanacetum coccineum]